MRLWSAGFSGCCLLSIAGCGELSREVVAEEVDAARVVELAVGGRARTTGNLNLRDGAGREFPVIRVMPVGSVVEIAGRSEGWYSVVFERTPGWASGAYLEGIAEEDGLWWRPQPGTRWQWQLSGELDQSLDVEMFDVDLFETPQRTIDELHAAGRVVICYFSAGSWEPGRPDSDDFPESAIGRVMEGWPDEQWLDVRSEGVRRVMAGRLDLARAKGCDGVEPDNVDGFANATGFSLTGRDQLAYNRFLAGEAHARGLSIGLKNDLDQVEALAADFDWALNEECFAFDECDLLAPFIDRGKAVFQVEYGGSGSARRVCADANARGFDTLIKNLDLDAFRISCR